MTARPSIERNLVKSALVLAVGAALVGSPEVGGGRLSPEHLLAAALEGEGQVGAVELGGWMLPDDGTVRVIDLREAEAFQSANIPGSERVDLSRLDQIDLRRGQTVVLVASEEESIWGWAVLRARGVEAFRLAGGIASWERDLTQTVLPLDASPEARERFAVVAELARHFGGRPRVTVMGFGDVSELLDAPEGGRSELDAFLRKVSRRGCGFR